MFKKIALVAALAATSFAASAATNLVVDGSFESTLLDNGSWTTVASTDGWTAGVLGLELRNNIAGTTPFGDNYAELDTSKNSSISQLLTGLSGSYELTFWVEDRPGTDASTNGISYTVNGVTRTVGGGLTGWTQVTEYFTANGSTTLSFAATGTSDGYGSSLDNISVVSVPEPASMGLMAIGLALVGIARRRQAR